MRRRKQLGTSVGQDLVAPFSLLLAQRDTAGAPGGKGTSLPRAALEYLRPARACLRNARQDTQNHKNTHTAHQNLQPEGARVVATRQTQSRTTHYNGLTSESHAHKRATSPSTIERLQSTQNATRTQSSNSAKRKRAADLPARATAKPANIAHCAKQSQQRRRAKRARSRPSERTPSTNPLVGSRVNVPKTAMVSPAVGQATRYFT